MRGRPLLLMLLLPFGLAACAFLDAVGFDSDDRSFKNEDQRVSVALIRLVEEKKGQSSSTSSTANQRASQSEADQEFSKLPAAVLEECTGPTKHAVRPATAPALIPIVVGVANVVLNTAAGEIADYLDSKQKEFVASYDARMNDPAFQLGGDESVRCIQIVRHVTDKDVFEKSDDCGYQFRRKDIQKEAMRFVASIEPVGGGFVLRPLYLNLAHSAARTGLDKGVNLKISVGISTLRVKDGVPEPGALTVQEFVIPGVKLTGPIVCSNPGRKHTDHKPRLPDYFGEKFDSSVFGTSKPMPTTATVVVAVTETGSGAETFAEARKDFDRNSEAIRGALGDALTERLNKK